MPQAFPRGANCVVDTFQVGAISGEDVKRPVRLDDFVDPVLDFHGGHVSAARKAAYCLQGDPLQVLFGHEYLGHDRAPDPLFR
jgi:hypothetical protein